MKQKSKKTHYGSLKSYQRFQTFENELKARSLKKSNWYRDSLEDYIGKTVSITGTYIRSENKVCSNRRGIRHGFSLMLLKNAEIGETGKKIEHIWIMCDKSYATSRYKQGNKVMCTGRAYEYADKGRRNIGIALFSSKKV